MASITVTHGADAGLVWHHGQPVAEQRAIEAGRGVVAWGTAEVEGRGVVTITGPDRLTWLHDLTSQHLDQIAAGDSFEALLLGPTGHIEHVLHGVDDGETVWAWTEPGQAGPLASWLDRMRFMTRVEVADRTSDVAIVWVGEQIIADEALASRRTPLGGRELFWPRSTPVPFAAEDGEATPAGTWAAEAIRIAHGQPRVGLDTDHKTIPNEIGLFGTHLDKGCYRGQETVARVHTLGRPPRRLVQLLLDGSVDALPEQGSAVMLDGCAVGVVGSSARHHELGPIALALVKRSVATDATLLVTSAEGEEIAAGQVVLVDPEVGLHVRPNLR